MTQPIEILPGVIVVEIDPPLPKPGEYKRANPPYKFRIYYGILQAIPLDVEEYDPSPYELYEICKLPPGDYQFLFTTQSMTEEQAGSVVEKRKGLMMRVKYAHYRKPDYHYLDTAIESFHSALTAKKLSIDNNYAVLKLKS